MDWYVFIVVGLALIILSLIIAVVRMKKNIHELNAVYRFSLYIIGAYNALYGNLSNDDISKANLILASEQRKQKQ